MRVLIVALVVVNAIFIKANEDYPDHGCDSPHPPQLPAVRWVETNSQKIFTAPPPKIVYHADSDGRNISFCRAKVKNSNELVVGRFIHAIGGCELLIKKTLSSEKYFVYEILTSTKLIRFRDAGNSIAPNAVPGGCDEQRRQTYICMCAGGNSIGMLYPSNLRICYKLTGSKATACANFQYAIVNDV